MIKLIVFIGLCLTVSLAQKNYTQTVQMLAAKIKEEPFKHSAWNRLAYISDTYGPRMWGSVVLEQVILEMQKQANAQKFQSVRLEAVSNFTKWVRGKQSLILYSPRPTPTKLDMIGLGGSVAGDVKAEVVVVESYEDLQNKKNLVPGKILLFNNQWVNYMESVTYRVDGPSIAAKYGAKAMLVRSVASQSISSVHTGYMEYNLTVSKDKIPCAAITVEDSEMFARMQKRNQTIIVHMVLQNQFVPNSNSYNLVFQIKGSKYPDQIVLAGGHIDSWDTGSQTGANDDGGGFITVFEAFRLLLKNGLRPQRTMRFVAWSGEESGSERDGAAQYLSRHKSEVDKHVAAFESDLGSTKLLGFGHQGPGKQFVQKILNDYMSILNATKYEEQVFTADIEELGGLGVPIFDNVIEDTPDHSFYFKYHHSAGDSMSMMDPDDMDSNVVGIAAFLYIIADSDQTVRDCPSDYYPHNLRSLNLS